MTLKSTILKNSLYFLFSLLSLESCVLFRFSSAALPADIKTFSIQEFYSEVSDGPTDMTKKLTEALETKVSRMTTLTRAEKDGDIQYEGVIKSFSYRTTFTTQSEIGSSPKEVQRLTITVEVSFLQSSDEEVSFKKKQFSASADMVSTEKEDELVDTIFRNLVDDICSKSIDHW